MVDAGLEAEWRVIWGQEEFFQVTKTIHNALQGSPEGLGEAERAIYDDYNRRNAETLDDSWDIVIVHDPSRARWWSTRARRRATGSGAATSTSRSRIVTCSPS